MAAERSTAPGGRDAFQLAPALSLATYQERIARVRRALERDNLDAFVALQPESVTYLSGFWTRGYTSFQAAIIPVEQDPFLVCRDVEGYYVDKTCVFADHAFWADADEPITIAAKALHTRLGHNLRIAFEADAWPLTVERYKRLQDALPDADWADRSRLVADMRLIKNEEEIAYQRRAGAIAGIGMQAGADAAGEGYSERAIAAEVSSAMVLAGSDLPGPGVLSSGERALHLHGSYSDRVLDRGDLVQLETTPNVQNYHARFMRPIVVGEARDELWSISETLVAIQDEALRCVKNGACAADADCVYREGVLGAGLQSTYTHKTFYSVGLLLAPNSSEYLAAAPGCDWSFQTGMVFHTYVLSAGLGFSETVAVTDDGFDRLTNFPRKLIVSGGKT